jgi:hypothetical protein
MLGRTYRTSPNEVTSRSMVNSLRRKDFAYGDRAFSGHGNELLQRAALPAACSGLLSEPY